MTTDADQQSGTWRLMIDCGAVEEVQVRYSADGRGEWRATNGNLDGYVVGATLRATLRKRLDALVVERGAVTR